MKTLAFSSIVTALILTLCGCNNATKEPATAMTNGGNPEAGRQEIEYYGCASCHVVPGVPGAQGLIGPSLAHLGDRNYIAGVVNNSPDNLIRWIQHAPQLNPKTAMPDLDLPDQTARDIASYLYTVK